MSYGQRPSQAEEPPAKLARLLTARMIRHAVAVIVRSVLLFIFDQIAVTLLIPRRIITEVVNLTVDGDVIEVRSDRTAGKRIVEDAEAVERGTVPAVAMGTARLPLSLVSTKFTVPTVRSLSDYQLQPEGSKAEQAKQRARMRKLAEGSPGGDGNLDFLRRTAASALDTSLFSLISFAGAAQIAAMDLLGPRTGAWSWEVAPAIQLPHEMLS